MQNTPKSGLNLKVARLSWKQVIDRSSTEKWLPIPDGNIYIQAVNFAIWDSGEVTEYFDQIQEQLETLASMDDLLSGENSDTVYYQ